MAILEIHNGSGAVEYVTIRREQPVVFGSDPKCDIRLAGPGVLPFHGRIGWKGHRYRVEAFPESRSLDFNGKQVISASFRTGDEVRVGPCVIYMSQSDDPDAPAKGAETSAGARPQAQAGKAAPRARSIAAGAASDTAAAVAVATAPKSKLSPLLDLFTTKGPGEERVLSSPLVMAMGAVMFGLTVAGVYLYKEIRRSSADQIYNKAVESLEQGSYKQALDGFDKFLAGHRDDPRANKARVLHALADVRQFSGGITPSWTEVIKKSKKMIEDVGKYKEFEDEKLELAEIVLKAAEGMADNTKAKADAALLKETEGASLLLSIVLGNKSADKMRSKSRFPAKYADAQAAVTKAQSRVDALAAIDKALEAKSAVGVYKVREELLSTYPDLGSDTDLVKRIDSANELLRAATQFDPTTKAGESTPRPEPLGPPTSLVLRLDTESAPTANPPLIYALAGGFATALDGSNGAPVWQVPVGLTSPFPPQPVTGGAIPSVMAFDARYNELVRLNAKTGALIWRQEIGVPITEPPLMLGNQVVLASPVGRLTQIDFETGEVRGALDLGRKLTRSPVADETGKFLYVMGDEANLFLIALERNRMSCTGVEYIGHGSGSIPCAPARIGRFLVVVENQTMLDGRWIVYLLDEDGSAAKKVQQVPISGWTWAPPPTSGKTIWSVGDRGGVTAFAIGPYDKSDPFRLAGQVVPDAERSGPAYGKARSERELWRSSSLSAKFDLDPEQSSLSMGWTLQEAGPSLGPIQQADRLIAFTHQYSEGQGVALWGVNPADGKVAWRTVLGTPWVSPPSPAADGSGLVLAANDGRPMTIPLEKLKTGGFVAQPINKPGSPKFLSSGATILQLDGLTITVPSNTADHYLLSENGGAPTRVNLTEALAAPPTVWKGGLVLPAGNGWVYWVDPRNGEPKADPYMPAYDRSKPIQWRVPLVIDDESLLLTDSGGRIHRLIIREEPRPRLVAQPADPLELGNAVVADPILVGGTAIVTTADDRVRGILTRDLGNAGAWKLEGARAAGPYRIGEGVLVGDESGRLLSIAGDTQTTWTSTPGSAPMAGPPALVGDAAWVVGRNGEFRKINLQDGSEAARLKAEFLPAGGLAAIGQEVAVFVGPGTIRLLTPSAP